MTDFKTLMQAHGFHATQEGKLAPESPLAPETDGAGSLTPLSCFEVLAVNGADGERFLQGQTSQQLALVDGSLAPLTAFCTPKGRILAMAQLMRLSEDCLWLLMPTGTAEPLRAHLAKFAPFYKVSLEVREGSVVVGLTGEPALTRAAEQLADAASSQHTALGPHDFAMLATSDAVLARQPGAETVRGVLVGSNAQVTRLSHALLDGGINTGDENHWAREDIRAGLQWVDSEQTDAWLPQMLNLEALAAISFKKGCYTGQEVVARAHFRGQVKKRLQRLTAEPVTPLPQPGGKVVSPEGKAMGEILRVANNADGSLEVLAVVSLRDEEAPLTLETGEPLHRAPLPYPLERRDPEQLKA